MPTENYLQQIEYGELDELLTNPNLSKGLAFLCGDDKRLLVRFMEEKITEIKNEMESRDIPAGRPIGVSQWKNHGIKYGYWTYFEKQIIKEEKNKWLKKLKEGKICHNCGKEKDAGMSDWCEKCLEEA